MLQEQCFSREVPKPLNSSYCQPTIPISLSNTSVAVISDEFILIVHDGYLCYQGSLMCFTMTTDCEATVNSNQSGNPLPKNEDKVGTESDWIAWTAGGHDIDMFTAAPIE